MDCVALLSFSQGRDDMVDWALGSGADVNMETLGSARIGHVPEPAILTAAL